MRTQVLGLMSLIAFASTPLFAQPAFTVGTDPSAETELLYGGNLADTRGQTFTAAGTSLLRASIWFFGHVPEPAPAEGYFSRLFLVRVCETDLQSLLAAEPLFQSDELDQTVRGRYTFTFADPINLQPGDMYALMLFTNNGGAGYGSFPNQQTQLPCSYGFGPCVEVTTSDAYAGGAYLPSRFGDLPSDPNRDMRFELLYAGAGPFAVPEPAPVGLLLLGLAATVFAWRRHRIVATKGESC